MLCYRQQFNVVVSQLLHIRHQLLGQIPVTQGIAVFIAFPGTKMHLISVHRCFADLAPAPLRPKRLIVPFIPPDIIEFGSRAGPRLSVEGIGIRLHADLPIRAGDGELVKIILLQPWHKPFPNFPLDDAHRVFFGVPIIEIADHGHLFRMGRPHAEHITVRTLALCRVRAEKLIPLSHGSLVKHMAVKGETVFSSHVYQLLVFSTETILFYRTFFEKMEKFSTFFYPFLQKHLLESFSCLYKLYNCIKNPSRRNAGFRSVRIARKIKAFFAISATLKKKAERLHASILL